MSGDAIDDAGTFAAEVSWHYYVNGLTQAEIAKLLDTTRLRVNQAIQKAKALGIVKIEVDSPLVGRVELQERTRSMLGVRRVLCAPAPREAYEYHNAVGTALAGFVGERLRTKTWRTLGVSWGMTIEAAIQRLPQLSDPGLEIVSMLGGTMRGRSFNTFNIASGFATRLGAKYSLLAAPIFLSNSVERDLFLSQAIFADHFAKFPALDAAILTASDVSPRSFLVANGLPGDVMEELKAAGAVGDVLGRFLDAEGRSIAHPIDARTIGVDLATVERIPEKVLAAAGPHKVGIIRAAARRGLVDTLITDDVTAEILLSQADADEQDQRRAAGSVSRSRR